MCYKIFLFCSCAHLIAWIQLHQHSQKPLDEMFLIVAVAISSISYVLLKCSSLGKPLQNTLVSHCIHGVKYTVFLSAISPNARRIEYLKIVLQMSFLLLIKTNDYSSLTYNIKKDGTLDTTSTFPHYTPYVSVCHGLKKVPPNRIGAIRTVSELFDSSIIT